MSLLSSQRTAGPFVGTGSSVLFPFAFPTDAVTDIVVTKSTTSGATQLTLGVHYSVTLNSNQATSPGGTVSLNSALGVGETLFIESNLDYTQPTQLPPGGDYEARIVEGALDRIVKLVQQLWARTIRAVTLPPAAIGVSAELPLPQSGQLLAWNSNGDALQNVLPQNLLTQAGSSGFKHQLFSPDGAQNQFTLSENPGSISNTDVALNGVVQRPGVDYTLSGALLTMTSAPAVGANTLLVRWGQTYPINITPPVTSLAVSTTLDVGGNTTIGGKLTVGDPNLGFELSGTTASANLAANGAIRYDRPGNQMLFVVNGATQLVIDSVTAFFSESVSGGKNGARGYATLGGGTGVSTGFLGFFTTAGVRQGAIGFNSGAGLIYNTDGTGEHFFNQNLKFDSGSGIGLQDAGYRGAPLSLSGLRNGEVLVVTGGLTVNTSDLVPGREYGVYNNSASNVVIAQGAGVTLRKDGTATTGDMTIAQRKLVAIWCLSATEAIVIGAT
jgi:hypothetical protein